MITTKIIGSIFFPFLFTCPQTGRAWWESSYQGSYKHIVSPVRSILPVSLPSLLPPGPRRPLTTWMPATFHWQASLLLLLCCPVVLSTAARVSLWNQKSDHEPPRFQTLKWPPFHSEQKPTPPHQLQILPDLGPDTPISFSFSFPTHCSSLIGLLSCILICPHIGPLL